MGTLQPGRLGGLCLLVLLQAGRWLCEEDATRPPCQPGFGRETYAFPVFRRELNKGQRLGEVSFESCTGRSHVPYASQDSHFAVRRGAVFVKQPLWLREQERSFGILAWDAAGKQHSARVVVRSHHHGHHSQEEQGQQHHAEPHGPAGGEVLPFPKSHPGLRRQKRDWFTIFPIHCSENDIGPFPKKLQQIGTYRDQEITVFYSITGPGADEPPEGVFIMDKTTGWLSVTQPLDREHIDKYVLLSHAVSANGNAVEDPMEIIIEVGDQNDNRPQFTQAVFHGSVQEGATIGTSVVQVTATDADDAVLSLYGALSYSIVSQDPPQPHPQVFHINEDTGMISVIQNVLDREKFPRYTLIVQAADMVGQGLSTTATAVIEVTEATDKPPSVKPTKAPHAASSTGHTTSSLPPALHSDFQAPHAMLTVHALNVLTGLPAVGLAMRLSHLEEPQQQWVHIMNSTTNDGGKMDRSSTEPRELKAGIYKLHFETQAYWQQQGQPSFYPYVEIVFTITENDQKVHIPLLLSPFSYTTYRGN